MGLKEQYENRLNILLNDKTICKPNRDLFKRFFEEQEYKLKRKRKLDKLNDKVLKTLVGYINRLRNVNSFFNNKDWRHLTESDIKKVYDDLEEGKLLSEKGKPFKDKGSYYNKIMKSKPFQIVGKDILAKKVIVATTKEEDENDREVRFILEEDYKKILSIVIQPKHKLALWLGWDIGENISSLLQLKVSDCRKLYDNDTKEPYYNIRLRKEILKTGRTKRTEPTLYPETSQLLDIMLQGKGEEEKIFDFDKPALVKVWKRAIEKTKVKCEPDKQKPTLKDIRSAMACHLLDKDWTTDEIKSRLGHKPSSIVIDKYVNYKAKNKNKTKKKIRIFEVEKLKEDILEIQQRDKMKDKRIEELQGDIKFLKENIDSIIKEIRAL